MALPTLNEIETLDLIRRHVARDDEMRRLEPVDVMVDAPLRIGGTVYRLTYDLPNDKVVLITERAWLEQAERMKARLGQREPRFDAQRRAGGWMTP